MGLSRVVRKQHSLICHYTAISRSHENNLCVNHSCMHCICVVYYPVTAWNTLKDLQNYSNYSRLYVISNYRHSSVSQTILHQQITKSKSSPDPVLVKKT